MSDNDPTIVKYPKTTPEDLQGEIDHRRAHGVKELGINFLEATERDRFAACLIQEWLKTHDGAHVLVGYVSQDNNYHTTMALRDRLAGHLEELGMKIIVDNPPIDKVNVTFVPIIPDSQLFLEEHQDTFSLLVFYNDRGGLTKEQEGLLKWPNVDLRVDLVFA